MLHEGTSVTNPSSSSIYGSTFQWRIFLNPSWRLAYYSYYSIDILEKMGVV